MDALPHCEKQPELLPRLGVMTFLGYLSKLQAQKPTLLYTHKHTQRKTDNTFSACTNILKCKLKYCIIQSWQVFKCKKLKTPQRSFKINYMLQNSYRV